MTHFSHYHPVTNFVFFALVIGHAMVIFHPVYMVISLLASFLFNWITNGQKGLKFVLTFCLPAWILIALFNPLFSHAGMTILFYFPNGNPFTLESVIYGVVTSTMFITVILWFASSNTIMTGDKLMHLFGRIIPKSSLIISMVLRFVPLYKQRIRLIAQGQAALHDANQKRNLLTKAKDGIQILSIMTTWSLQSSIETANSMKARGYGLSARTAYTQYRFTSSDRKILIILLSCALFIIALQLLKVVQYSYYPYISYTTISSINMLGYFTYALMCFLPCILSLWREFKWTYSISKI